MSVKIGINGFGRIGRSVFRILSDRDDLEVVAVNDLFENDQLAYLLRFDTVMGVFDKDVEVDEESMSIDGDRIDSRDDGVSRLHVVRAAARRAVARQNTRRVENHERWFHHECQIGDDAVDILVELIAPSAEKPIPILNGHRRVTQIVVLQRRDADHFISVDERLVKHWPVF